MGLRLLQDRATGRELDVSADGIRSQLANHSLRLSRARISCFSRKGWDGLYHFSDQAELRPATAAERAELRKEWVGYPYIRLGSEHIEHYSSREGVTLGPLTGYAVLYRFVAKEGRGMFVDILAPQRGGLLVIQLADGCVSFETTILVRSGDDRDAWAPLN